MVSFCGVPIKVIGECYINRLNRQCSDYAKPVIAVIGLNLFTINKIGLDKLKQSGLFCIVFFVIATLTLLNLIIIVYVSCEKQINTTFLFILNIELTN